MLRTYGASVVGPSHANRGIPCQDAHASRVLSDGTAVAAVADGLGSELHPDVGSRVASLTAVEYLAEHASGWDSDASGTTLMRAAFRVAHDAVLDEAAAAGNPADQYDSTLCVAMLRNGRLVWGQSGDSGMVACLWDGTYVTVTEQQRNEDGDVYPLCFRGRWEFGVVEDVATVILCTDGVLDGIISPRILRMSGLDPIDKRMAGMFLHPQEGDGENLADIEAQLAIYLEGIPSESVNDDKTVLVVFDDEKNPCRREDGYYDAPDYEALLAQTPDPPALEGDGQNAGTAL